MKEVSLYIHIPFCKSKCLYCDFLSFSNSEDTFLAYKNALVEEIKSLKKYGQLKIRSIFIGGGTPTVLPPSYIKEIMEEIDKVFTIDKNIEITMESNPGTVTLEGLKIVKASGINRISMGLQAWQNDLLKTLGRIHTNEEFLESYDNVVKAGFQNINVDLMFSLPKQTISMWEETIHHVVALKPSHISAYSLIIEEGTPFAKMYNEKNTPSEEMDRDMYDMVKNILKGAGYGHYEISNFAIHGKESRHNLVYWQREEYIGLGLSAHSFFNHKRFHNTSSMEEYINKKISMVHSETISEKDAYGEFMFLGLRLVEGIRKSNFKKSFNKDIDEIYGTEISKLQQENLLAVSSDTIRLTERGIDVSNYVFEKFI